MSTQQQGCELLGPGAYQAVVKTFRIIYPEAGPTEAHSDRMAGAELSKQLEMLDDKGYLWRKSSLGGLWHDSR